MSDREYCYPPDFTILRNKLNIRDLPTLEAAERQFVAQRLLEAVPEGDFDLDHLSAIHRHLFRDIYEWAGNVRTVEISKGSRSQALGPRRVDGGLTILQPGRPWGHEPMRSRSVGLTNAPTHHSGFASA